MHGFNGAVSKAMPGSWPANDFPLLTPADHNITSPASPKYNCIAWAVEDSAQWWEPDPDNTYHWPLGVPRDYTLQAFIEAYRTHGYDLCDDGHAEEGFEKIAIYVNADGDPQHAARLLPNGRWASKLGPYEDIEHATLECLNGELYGTPQTYLRRPLAHPPEL